MWPLSETKQIAPAAPTLSRPNRTRISESDKWRMDLLVSAANAHLQRSIALAQVEWNVTLLFWGALLTSGISFTAYASNSSPPAATYIAHNDYVIILAYMTASAIFIFGFSINQARSIIEARSQYQLALNAAHLIASLEPIARTGGTFPIMTTRLPFWEMTRNIVWKTKLLSTFLFASGVWVVTQVLAHGNISLAKKITPDTINLSCAFFDCQNDNVVNWGTDRLEVGTWMWLLCALCVVGFWLRGTGRVSR